ncbi:MAG TPA: protein kinase [Gemmataceae bacterium]|nr:protein kinase [Gemmataceae bacterium]
MNDAPDVHPSREQLSAFDSGQLHDAEWEEVERHVAHCATCCGDLEALPEDAFALLLRSSASKPTVPPFCESKQTPPGYAVSSADTLPRRLKAAVSDVPPELAAHPRYRILEFLGAGGMGTVFKAEHRLMERVVALKIIRKDLMDRPAALERFPQEVRAAARLVHPHIVTAYDADQAGDVHFLVMEYVEGKSLDRVLAQSGPFRVDQACDWIHQAAQGLQHAWEQGMVHRDIKPGNMLLTSGGQIKILDFGLARFANESVSAAGLTPEGSMVGTPDYMAPEQAAAAGNADIRADIYSLGCTLYHLLVGEPPFPDGAPLHKLLLHQTRQPRLVSELRGDVPGELAQIIARMLAKDPAERYETPTEVARELEPFVEGEWPTVPIRKPASGGIPLPSPAGQPTPSAPPILPKAGSGRFRGRSWRLATIVGLVLVGATTLGSVAWHVTKSADSKDAGDVSGTSSAAVPKNLVPIAIGPSRPAKAPEQKPAVAAPGPSIRSISVQTGPFARVAFSPDRRRALAAGPEPDFALQLWDLDTAQEIAFLEGHPVPVLGLAFSPDGKQALSGHQDFPESTMCLWDLQNKCLLRKMKGHHSWVRGVTFLPDGRYALSGSNDARLLLWDTKEGDPIQEFKGHVAPVGGVAVSRFDRYAASSGWDDTIRIWDLLEKRQIHILRGHEGPVPTVIYSHDGRYVLSASEDRTLRLWQVEPQEMEVQCFRGHTGPVTSVALSANNVWALSGSVDHTVRLWDVRSGQEIHCFDGHMSSVLAVAFCPDGRTAVSCDEEGTFFFWPLPQ